MTVLPLPRALVPQVLPANGRAPGPTQIDLPTGVSLRLGWPQRTAVLLSAEPHDEVVDVMRAHGFTAIRFSPDLPPDSVDSLDPFTFLLLGPEAVEDPAGREALSSLRLVSPFARVLLLSDSQTAAPTLLAALRAGVDDVVDPTDPAALSEAVRGHLTTAGATRERVLAIGAHPDDIEIGCAGSLLEHRRRGDRVSLLTMSHGAVGGVADDRGEESVAAAETLGGQLLLADLPDTSISDGIDTIRMIEAVVQAIDPTVIYVHSKHDNHQDHRAVHSATLSAARGVPRLLAYQSPSATNDFTPTKFVAIDEVVIRKLEVLARFESQRDRSYLDAEAVVSGARYWARHLAPRARFAEPFEIIRAIEHPNAMAASARRTAPDSPGIPEQARLSSGSATA